MIPVVQLEIQKIPMVDEPEEADAKVGIATHAGVFYTNQFCNVVEMIEGVFDRRGPINLDDGI